MNDPHTGYPDYSTIRRTLEELNGRYDGLENVSCPRPVCEGSLQTDGNRVECTGCRRVVQKTRYEG